MEKIYVTINFLGGDIMDTEIMKNMVVIKNLPSNMIEEAFVILKPNLKVKELDTLKLEKNNNSNIEKNTKKNNDYVIREAEMLVSEYISKIEKKDSIRKNIDIEKKYKKLKNRAIASISFAIICLIISIIFQIQESYCCLITFYRRQLWLKTQSYIFLE